MAITDLNYHSYFSLHTTADSTASTNEYNIFDEDRYSSYSFASVSSPDITYTSGDGKITFGAAGVYLIVVDVPVTVSGNTRVVGRLNINGTAVYTSDNLFAIDSADPFTYTFQTILTISKGDYLQVTLESSHGTRTLVAQNGASVVALKSNGDYANLFYTASANAAGSGPAEFTIFDSDNGGTVQSTLNNVTFAAGTGLLTPANTRTFLMLASLMAEAGTDGEASLKLYANGSAVDDVAGLITSYEPIDITYGFLSSLTGGQTASARTIGAGTITAEKGTSFTLFDITNNAGASPKALLSFTVDADSSDLADGNDICFDSNKWGSYAKTDRVTASGITYTADGGTFVTNSPGKYFILWNLVLGTADTGDRTIVIKNGSTEVYTAPMHMHSNLDPMEKTTCVILSAAAGDSFTFVISEGEAKIDAGTSITMFKVDDLGDLFPESEASTQIGDDYTINTQNPDVVGKQHSNITDKRTPFSVGVPGPGNLRGRTTAYAPSLGGKTKK
tara:strand:- start:2004 stop:3515 length:1512 start_codon:yes stop_codon:yes gene_type:complete